MKRLITRLQKQGKQIAVAESCTGGLVAKRITDTPGASAVFGYGVTVYSNEAKMKLLGVKKETLDTYGAVSENTVCEMASGVLALAGADIAIAISGIAGPNNDGSEKPVGTVCIGVATNEKCYGTTFVFAGKRNEIRRMAAKMALDLAYGELKPQRGANVAKEKKGIKKKASSAVKKTKTAIKKLIKKD